MKTVCKLNQCAGCMACIEICPNNAINIYISLKTYNAVIDENRCVNCNSCYKVCQECNLPKLNPPLLWREGWAKDSDIRLSSSSGGIATAIEQNFVKQGGVVCSCVFENGSFIFSDEDTEENIKKFTGSKYVKSNPIGIYKKMLQLLKNGRKVLFVGLPCQIAAAQNFIGDRENFYTIDLICHGTPSPKILEAFLNDKELDLKN